MDCFYPLMYNDLTIIIPLDESNCTEQLLDLEWYGSLPTHIQLDMTVYDAGLYYGILGIICAWAFIHHFRSF